MSNKQARKMRREVRSQLREKLGETESALMVSIASASLSERLVFAWRVVFNVWPQPSGKKK